MSYYHLSKAEKRSRAEARRRARNELRSELLNGLATIDLEGLERHHVSRARGQVHRIARWEGARFATRVIREDEFGQGPYLLVWRLA